MQRENRLHRRRRIPTFAMLYLSKVRAEGSIYIYVVDCAQQTWGNGEQNMKRSYIVLQKVN